ncbi:MAG: hypothetical protein ACK55Z_38065, partial [bacterium]
LSTDKSPSCLLSEHICLSTDKSPSQPLLRDGAGRAPPWAEVSGSQTDLLTPWHDGRAEIIPFQYMPPLLGEGKGIRSKHRSTKIRGT